MKSLAPQEYESLSPLDSPAGYICVIRDIDSDRYRIESTRIPQALINEVIAERQRSFGIELVSVVQTDDLKASEAELYACHHARLSSEWLELDALQLEELRQSLLETDAFASLYLMTGILSSPPGGAAQAVRSYYRPDSASEAALRSDRRAGGEGASRPLASHHYGYWALGRRRRGRESSDADAAGRARQANSNWSADLFAIYPIAGFVVILVVAFVAVGMLRERSFYRGTDGRLRAVALASPTAVHERPAPSPTPAGKPYVVAQRVPVFRCASITCRRPVLLSKDTQIWALQAVKGPPVNGSSVWIEYQLYGEAAFVPISYLEAPD